MKIGFMVKAGVKNESTPKVTSLHPVRISHAHMVHIFRYSIIIVRHAIESVPRSKIPKYTIIKAFFL